VARNNIISLTCVIFCSLHSYILRQPPRIKPPGQFDAYLILIHLKDCYIFPCMWNLSITRTILCRVKSRTSPPQHREPGNEIMDLRRVIQFSFLPSPVQPSPGTKVAWWTTLVWPSEQLTSSKLSLGLVSKFSFCNYLGAGKGSRAGSVYLHFCWWYSIHYC